MTLLKAGRPTTTKKEKAISSVQEDHVEYVKMSMNIPKAKHKKLKQYALDNDTTATDVILELLDKYIHI